jgi:hypothetical protein
MARPTRAWKMVRRVEQKRYGCRLTGGAKLGLIIILVPVLGFIAGLCVGVVSYLLGFSFWTPVLICTVLGFGVSALFARQVK